MATFAPAQLAKGAARQPLPYGLFSLLNFGTPDGPHWQAGGATWEAAVPVIGIGAVGHPTGAVDGTPDTDPPGSPSTGVPKQFPEVDDELLNGLALPFSVYGHWKYSGIGYSQDEANFLALEHLTAFEEAQVEEALWTGNLNNVPNLTDDIVALTPTAGIGALAELEQHIATTYGSLGVIHMSRKEAMLLVDGDGLETKGSLLRTKLGTPVVAGAGYPSGFARATPALFGFRSEVFYSDQPGSPLINVQTNDQYAIAERTYLIGFDPTGVGSVDLNPEP